MAQMTRTLLFVAALLAVASVASAQDSGFTWGFEDFVRGALSKGLSFLGDGQDGQDGQDGKETKPEEDAPVCSQVEVCDKDGKKYPNQCAAEEAGVEVAPCPAEARSGGLLGIPEAFIGIGQDIFEFATAPLKSLTSLDDEEKEDEDSSDGSFDLLDPLDNVFKGLGRRLLTKNVL